MAYADTLLPEFDHEMASTRKVLEQLPDDIVDWRPHAKSNTIGWNANHLADLPGWAVAILTQPQFDFAPVGGKRYELPKLGTRRKSSTSSTATWRRPARQSRRSKTTR